MFTSDASPTHSIKDSIIKYKDSPKSYLYIPCFMLTDHQKQKTKVLLYFTFIQDSGLRRGAECVCVCTHLS